MSEKHRDQQTICILLAFSIPLSLLFPAFLFLPKSPKPLSFPTFGSSSKQTIRYLWSPQDWTEWSVALNSFIWDSACHCASLSCSNLCRWAFSDLWSNPAGYYLGSLPCCCVSEVLHTDLTLSVPSKNKVLAWEFTPPIFKILFDLMD